MKYSKKDRQQAREQLAKYPKSDLWRLLEDEELPRTEREKLTDKPFEFGG